VGGGWEWRNAVKLGFSTSMGSRFSRLPEEEGPWVQLPEELLLRVLEILLDTASFLRRRRDSGAVRGTCRRWRAIHDGGCKTLRILPRLFYRRFPYGSVCCPEEVICALCGRLPALTTLNLREIQSLATEALSVVGGLTALMHLDLHACSSVTDAGLWELRDLKALRQLSLYACPKLTDAGLLELRGLSALTYINLTYNSEVTDVGLQELSSALTELHLNHCSNVTDVGLQELSSLTQLTTLWVIGCSTSRAGRDALKAAIPGLTIYG
jgi:hypothetical protein